MRGSTKTTPSIHTRYGALKHLLSNDIPLQVILEAAQALQAARTAQGDQNAQAAASVQATITELAARAVRAGSDHTAPTRPVTAFHLQRALTRRAAMPAVLDEAWNEDATRGPADLIRHFVRVAISEFHPEIGQYDEQSQEIILAMTQFATDTALRLASVAESWIDEYEALTAYLRQ